MEIEELYQYIRKFVDSVDYKDKEELIKKTKECITWISGNPPKDWSKTVFVNEVLRTIITNIK